VGRALLQRHPERLPWLLPRLAEVASHNDQFDADLLDFLKARANHEACLPRS
jgi:hypothetical protein